MAKIVTGFDVNRETKCQRLNCDQAPKFHVCTIQDREILEEQPLCAYHAREHVRTRVVSNIGSTTREIRIDQATPCELEYLLIPSGRASGTLILREQSGERCAEAQCSALETRGLYTLIKRPAWPFPFLYDVVANMANESGWQFLYTHLHPFESSGFTAATLVLTTGTEEKRIPSGCGDGVTMAIRTNVPIVVSDSLLKKPRRS